MNLLDSLFRRRDRGNYNQKDNSSNVAKERLQLALKYDRVKISPEVMEKIKEEIIAVLSKHFDIDREAMDISMGERNDHLIANIPVKRTREYNLRK